MGWTPWAWKSRRALTNCTKCSRAFKTGDPNGNGEADEIPLFCVSNYEQLLSYADFAYDAGTKTAVIDGVLTYIPTTDYYKDFLADIAALFAEGVLDPNDLTQSSGAAGGHWPVWRCDGFLLRRGRVPRRGARQRR